MRKTMNVLPWVPIADLTEQDVNAANKELGALAETWHNLREEIDPKLVEQFDERLTREWAIATGVMNHLYALDEDIALLLAEHGIDASLIPDGSSNQPSEFVAEAIRAHTDSMGWLLDNLGRNPPLGVSLIKEAHAMLTRDQQTVTVVDRTGTKIQVEPCHGEYKKWPKNPVLPDGTVRQHCPPEHVRSEMERLIDMHRAHTEAGVPPDVRAAWLLHRFVQIHPFQDGNGRVARAVASLVLVEAGWFPMILTREDRSRYTQALAAAGAGNLAKLADLIAETQKRLFIRALSIADETRNEAQNIDNMLDAIGDMFSRTEPYSQPDALRRARRTANDLWDVARERFGVLAEQLEARLGNAYGRSTWTDFGYNNDKRRRWHRYQIVATARELGYFANTRGYHQWSRLGINTENGRSEILISFHDIGKHTSRWVVGASMCLYRRNEAENIEDHITDIRPVSRDVFQINYVESPEHIEERFRGWLEQSLVKALGIWRKSG